MSSNLGGLNSEGDLCSVYQKVSHHQLQGSLRSDNVNDSKTSSENRTLHFWNSFLMISVKFVWFAKSKSALVQLNVSTIDWTSVVKKEKKIYPQSLMECISSFCYTKFATTAQGPKMFQAKQLVKAKFSVLECFISQL